MEGFSININFWNNITGYVTDIMANPFKLIIFILDILIVGYIDFRYINCGIYSI